MMMDEDKKAKAVFLEIPSFKQAFGDERMRYETPLIPGETHTAHIKKSSESNATFITSKSLSRYTETDAHFLYAGYRLFFHQVIQEKSVCPSCRQGNRGKGLFVLKTCYATTRKTTSAVTQFIAQSIGKGDADTVVPHFQSHPKPLVRERMRNAQSDKNIKYRI